MRELVAGRTNQEAAAAAGITPQRVVQLKQSELFQRELEEMEKDVREVFVEAEGTKQSIDYHRERLFSEIGRNIDTLIEVRDEAENPETRRKSALDLLSMTPLDSKQQEAPPPVQINFSMEMSALLEKLIDADSNEVVKSPNDLLGLPSQEEWDESHGRTEAS